MANRLKIQTNIKEILKLKFLKIYRMEETKFDDQEENQQNLSLQEIISKSRDFLEGKIFEINIKKEANAPDFSYVHLKIKNMKKNRTLI